MTHTPTPHRPLALSRFGKKLTAKTGILELMDDMAKTMCGAQSMRMLGGGNPARIPALDTLWRSEMQAMMAHDDTFDRMIGVYDPPKGNPTYLKSIADYYRRNFGWNITERNIALTPGSQAACFYLFNMLAGTMPDGTKKNILLPLAPEYIGYADQGIDDDLFISCKPLIQFHDDHTYKYHISFDDLPLDENIGAMCVSRPTNPTGNVLTDDEIKKLTAIAEERGIPLMIDGAYGAPFPSILFREITPVWNENIVHLQTLSKLGLPTARLGIVIAREEIIEALSGINAIVTLANGSIGPYLTQSLFQTDRINTVSKEIIQPFYRDRSERAVQWMHEAMDHNLPYALHVCEGSPYLWMWLRDFPITTYEFYKRLKERQVLVVPGRYFFPGIADEWSHKDECIRINYSHNPQHVEEGIGIIAEEARRIYSQQS